jgi:hypothetical protein
VWHEEAANKCGAFSPLGDWALAGNTVGGAHLFRIVGRAHDEADIAQEPAPPTPHRVEPGLPVSGDSATLLAPADEANPRRKRLWFF